MATDLVVFAIGLGFGMVWLCALLATLMVKPYNHYASAADER